ncbi:MAG TPA: DUF6177 family protein [Streptosporangiaceae bacterium]|nr:DUF6177 family protein [Streptosporangiaceae bacterium]
MSTHPAVDAVTAKAMVVIQDREVVPFSQWLADALRVCTESGRGLQIITPVHSRLSMPLRLVLTGPNSRWVVRDDAAGGYYDGLTGVPLQWDGAAFVPVKDARDYAPAYVTRPRDQIGAQLTLTFQVRQEQVAAIGAAVEQLCMSLTGQEPAGWGTAEPAANRWRRDDVAGLYQRRAPRATWLTVVGGGRRAALGTMLLAPAQLGAEETVTLVVGYQPDDRPPVAALPTVIGVLAVEQRLLSLFAQLTPGRPDLTTEPRWVGSPAPIGMAVGGDMGRGAPGIPGQQIGDLQSPTLWYDLGDGRSQDGWQRYRQLMQHLRPSPA